MSKTPPVRRPSRRTNTTAGRVLSAALATTTCVGLVGVIGVRMADENAAQAASGSPDPAAAASTDQAGAIQLISTTSPAATSSSGLTREQLDAYAAQLTTERQRLIDYRNQLVAIATQLQQATTSGGASAQQVSTLAAKAASASVPTVKAATKAKAARKSKAKAKAKAKAVSAPAAQPQQAPAQQAQQQPPAQPAPQAKPAPQAAPQAAAPRPQAQSKSS